MTDDRPAVPAEQAGAPAGSPGSGSRRGIIPLLVAAFWNRDERRLRALWRILGFIALALGLLTAMQVSGLFPERGTSEFYMVVLPARLWAVLVAVCLAGLVLDRRPLRDYGLAIDGRWLVDLGFGLALGAAMISAVFLVQWAMGWLEITGTWRTRVDGISFTRSLLLPLAVFISVGILEEVVFRGYLLRNLAEGLAFRRLGGARGGLVVAVLISSALFAWGHAGNPNATWVSTLNIGFAGVFLALGIVLTAQLAIPIGLHITWNLFQASAFGFPVSGITILKTTAVVTEETGPDLWTGGPFGPEAGLLGLAAILLGIACTLAWVRWRQGHLAVAADFATPPPRDPPAPTA